MNEVPSEQPETAAERLARAEVEVKADPKGERIRRLGNKWLCIPMSQRKGSDSQAR